MKLSTRCASRYAGLAALLASSAVFAQQPVTIPGRSQSAGQQAVDSASCYAFANRTTHVNTVREPQRPVPQNASMQTAPARASAPLKPPLPMGASAAVEASAASATRATSASAAMPASAAATTAAASSPEAASASTAASAAGASLPSDAQYAGTKMPPLPPPEPPMVRYWSAYGQCMQRLGYYTR